MHARACSDCADAADRDRSHGRFAAGYGACCAAGVKPAPPSSPSILDESTALRAAARELARIERRMDEIEREMRAAIESIPEERHASARNLVDYVALREHDLRALQHDLAQLGLSSLGRSESWVRGSLLEVSRRVHEALALRGDAEAAAEVERLAAESAAALGWETANVHLHEHTHEILGPRPKDRHIYIMVTAPSADLADRAWMSTMLRAGMNVLRINCAHERPEAWKRMALALAEARRETGAECRVLMDLAGPKIRTGKVAGGRPVATWKPVKDEIGRVVAPARVVVLRGSTPLEEATGSVVALRDAVFDALRAGDELRFRDARGKRRRLVVAEVGAAEIVATAERRAYVRERANLKVVRAGRKLADATLEVRGGEGAAIDVRVGDTLALTARDVAGTPPRRGPSGQIEAPGLVACTLPEALDELAEGHRVLFDDGKIEAVVEKVLRKHHDFLLRVVRTQRVNAKLRAEKGINLPDTATKVPALTEEDLRALPFVVAHADAVSLSFVKRAEDVRRLHAELDRLGRPGLGVVLKIETRDGFEHLPRLLLEGLRRPPLAVMIARGDLAVEVGFERLAELQEEILWLCEASHVPAIWATQVLDTLARTGVPSRAEVTDAAASVAAECVMLNKGPFVDQAVRVLSDILSRMEKHHYKKRSLFRKLKVSTFSDTRSASTGVDDARPKDGSGEERRTK